MVLFFSPFFVLFWVILTGELTPSFDELWNAKAAKHKSKVGQQQYFKFAHHFEGTFLMGGRENLSLFPYDFEEISILLKSDKTKKCVFHPLRFETGIMAPDCMQGVDNWRAARTISKNEEQGSGESEWGFVWFVIVRTLGFVFFPVGKMSNIVKHLIRNQTGKEKREKLKNETPFWLQCQFSASDPSESATRQAYREIEIKAVLGRVSSYVTWSLLFPCTLVGTSALFQFWIHPVDGTRIFRLTTRGHWWGAPSPSTKEDGAPHQYPHKVALCHSFCADVRHSDDL